MNNPISIKREPYKQAVLRVESRYEDGTPEVLRLIKETSTAELAIDETRNHFIIVYIPIMDHSKYKGEIPTIL